MQKPYFYHFFWKKEVKLEKNQKKAVAGINCGPWPIFLNITHLTHFFGTSPKLPVHALIHGVSNASWPDTFFFTFSAKNRSNNKIFGKKNLWASTRSHDPFFDNPKIWPTFIYRGEVPAHTFAKLPVHALITDLKKFDPKKVISVKTPHLAKWPTSLSRPQYFGTSPKLPVHALIHDP